MTGGRAVGRGLDVRLPEDGPSTRTLTLVRVVQEALTNVQRHSRARRVDIARHWAERHPAPGAGG
mgnify:CR=1 FL=1